MQPFWPRAARATPAGNATTDAYRSTQALAWTALLSAAALFVLLAIFLPRGIGALLSGVQESRPALAEVIEGTVLYQPPAAAMWQRLPNAVDLPEGTRVRTDERSRVFLTLSDGSTLLVYPNTELALQRTAIGRFNVQAQETVLRLFGGRVHVAVARHPALAERAITLLANDARLDLPEGSYQVEIERDGTTDVGVRMGAATLWKGSRAMVVTAGLRARLGPRVPIEGPLPAERPLLQA
ncbi:MAG: FecR domain-containing protein, partial [Actinobacteria bacterium]|nr:FecR domain-containing protein [Actinomycetota bacterium]